MVRLFQIQAGKSKTKKHLGDLEVDEGKGIPSNYVEWIISAVGGLLSEASNKALDSVRHMEIE